MSHLSDELEHLRFSTVLRIYFAIAHHSPSLPSFYFLCKDDCWTLQISLTNPGSMSFPVQKSRNRTELFHRVHFSAYILRSYIMHLVLLYVSCHLSNVWFQWYFTQMVCFKVLPLLAINRHNVWNSVTSHSASIVKSDIILAIHVCTDNTFFLAKLVFS